MSPSNQCSTLPCGGMVAVELSLTGPDVLPNTSVASAPVQVNCVS